MTATESPEVQDVLDRALKLSDAERALIAWELMCSVYPELRASAFSMAELDEYLRARPDAVVIG